MDFVCGCGNTCRSDGFFPCDSDGVEVEPVLDSDWAGLYVCGRCACVVRFLVETGEVL